MKTCRKRGERCKHWATYLTCVPRRPGASCDCRCYACHGRGSPPASGSLAGVEKPAAAKPEALESGAYNTTGRGREVETLPQEGEQGQTRDSDAPNASPVGSGSNGRGRKSVRPGDLRPLREASRGRVRTGSSEWKKPVEANVTCRQRLGRVASKVSQMALQ
jgi:hypothetical protein